jgi:hypothetical protein
MTRTNTLTPLQAYECAERQKQHLGEAFRGKILGLHRRLRATGPDASPLPRRLPQDRRRRWRDVARAFAAVPAGNDDAIISAYRNLVMQQGLLRIDPAARDFERELRAFHRNYVTNFPLPEEQESRAGFRDLWKASPRAGGYEEVGYSVLCPLTGRYLMGLNFTIQPRSDSVHFIYGFVNPVARGFGGFSARLIALMRDTARPAIAAHYQRCPADRPAFHSVDGPLILFEKNMIEEMSLADILMDTAHVDVDRPPGPATRLAASSISQSVRDFIWDRRGGRVVDYGYIQSSLDGVVRVPDGAGIDIIALLNRAPLGVAQRRAATDCLAASLAGRVPGCLTLKLCAFVDPSAASVPASQIRLSNEIFQGISVVKDPAHVAEDIYFQAQMASLQEHARDGTVALRPIAPFGPGVSNFEQAERVTKRLLANLSWVELREGRELTYGEWLRHKGIAE